MISEKGGTISFYDLEGEHIFSFNNTFVEITNISIIDKWLIVTSKDGVVCSWKFNDLDSHKLQVQKDEKELKETFDENLQISNNVDICAVQHEEVQEMRATSPSKELRTLMNQNSEKQIFEKEPVDEKFECLIPKEQATKKPKKKKANTKSRVLKEDEI